MPKRPHTDAIDISFAVPFVHRLRFTRDVFGEDQGILADVLEQSGDRVPRVQFWLDESLARAVPELTEQIRTFCSTHADRFTRIGNVQLLPGGEDIKNDIHILERMLKIFHASDLDRRSYVVVIGGGAVLDAVGFGAAITHRGLRLVRLPTTTLAQADAGIGVKNAVNLFRKKNWIGTFSVPWAVINDAAVLETLSDREFICGFSECVKVALLKDPEMLDDLCSVASRIRNRDMDAALPMIRRSAEWHLQHITTGGDPFEALEARPLDFGHWLAHRLESISEFSIRHGEAVAVGVALDTIYSSIVHGFPRRDCERVIRCLRELGFALRSEYLEHPHPLFAGLEEFRQHLGGRLTVTMLQRPGSPIDVHDIDRDKMRTAMTRLLEAADRVA